MSLGDDGDSTTCPDEYQPGLLFHPQDLDPPHPWEEYRHALFLRLGEQAFDELQKQHEVRRQYDEFRVWGCLPPSEEAWVHWFTRYRQPLVLL